MKICILTTNENLAAVTAKAYEHLPQFAGQKILNYPLSASGNGPATHWGCQLEATPELREKLLNLKDLSEMEVMNFKPFIESKNLKIVRP